MARVPRYGIHDGIKYSPKRTLVYSCLTCGKYNIKTGRTDKYCDICAYNAKIKQDHERGKNRDNRNEYKREQMAIRRGNGLHIDKLNGTTTRVCGAPPAEPTDKDWMEYHNKIKKMKKDTLGGYQDYYDIDEDTNPYE